MFFKQVETAEYCYIDERLTTGVFDTPLNCSIAGWRPPIIFNDVVASRGPNEKKKSGSR